MLILMLILILMMSSYSSTTTTTSTTSTTTINTNSMRYAPQTHVEKWGMARQEAGVSLYSRKVLIQSK